MGRSGTNQGGPIMKKFLFLILLFTLQNCGSTEPEQIRIGAVCKDGTSSTATGSGACSGHGGVNYWIYK